MKLLALVFLFGFAAAYPFAPLKDADDEAFLGFLLDMEESMAMPYAKELDDDTKTELGKMLKEQLDSVLERIKEAVDHGKAIKEDLLEKAKVLKEKLAKLKIDIGNKAKELIEKIRDKAKDWFQKLFERCDFKDIEEIEYAESDDEIADRLKKKLDDALEQIKEAIDKGKAIKDVLIEKVKELRQKLKDLHIDVGNKAKELMQKIKDKAGDWLQKWLDKLTAKQEEEEYSEPIHYAELDDDKKTELGKRLQEELNRVLEKIEDAIERGKVVKKDLLDKAKDLREKLNDFKDGIGNKARELLEKIKEKVKGWLQKLLEKWGIRESSESYDDIDPIPVLRGILEKIRNEDSDEDIAEYIRRELRDSPLGKALLDVLKQGRTPLKQVCKTLLGLVTRDSRSIKDIYERIKDYLKDLHLDFKEKYANFLEWVKGVFSKGKDAAKDKITNIKEIAREFVKHVKQLNKEVAEEGLEFFRPYKEDLGALWEQIKKAAKDAIGH